MAAELDKSRNYAQVIGFPGVMFEQDGRHFNSDGDEVVAETQNEKTVSSQNETSDRFTDMNRDQLREWLKEKGETQYNPNGSDDNLRAVCREVEAEEAGQ